MDSYKGVDLYREVTKTPESTALFLARLGYSEQSIADTLFDRTDLSLDASQEVAKAAIIAVNGN